MWRNQPPPPGQPERRKRREAYLEQREHQRELEEHSTAYMIAEFAKSAHMIGWVRTLSQIENAEQSLAEYTEGLAL